MRTLVGILLAVAACGGGTIENDGKGADAGPVAQLPGLAQIAVTPATDAVTVENGKAPSVTYHAEGIFTDGHREDLTGRVQWRLGHPDLGTFAANVLTTATHRGGLTTVDAYSGTVRGSAQLTVKLKQGYSDPGATVPSNPGALFGGPAAPARKPTLVYPADGVLVPPNLGKLELHFLRGGDANTVFDLSLQSATLDLHVYTSCTQPVADGCIYLPDVKVWAWLAESNRGGEVTVTVRATDARGSGVGTSVTSKIDFSTDNLDGALYYWTTPAGEDDSSRAAIYRWDFASPTQTAPEVVVTPEMTGGHCVGCHALSPDGKRLFVTSEGSYDAFVLLYDVDARKPIVPWNTTDRVAWASWEWPEGDRFVGTFADDSEGSRFRSFDLNVYDASGAFKETIPVGGSEGSPSAHPDWAPDGSMIAFTRVGVAGDQDSGTTRNGARASLRLVARTGSAWGQPVNLTTAQKGRGAYYPTFSPDSKLLLFNQSVCGDGEDGGDCNMDDDATAALWIMKPEQGAKPIRLANAERRGHGDGEVLQSGFPRWTPITFKRVDEFGERLFWFTFSSNRGYGLRRPDSGETLIWMAGVDPDTCLNGEDGSYPAFALPFQDVHRDNHTAQWAKRSGILVE